MSTSNHESCGSGDAGRGTHAQAYMSRPPIPRLRTNWRGKRIPLKKMLKQPAVVYLEEEAGTGEQYARPAETGNEFSLDKPPSREAKSGHCSDHTEEVTAPSDINRCLAYYLLTESTMGFVAPAERFGPCGKDYAIIRRSEKNHHHLLY